MVTCPHVSRLHEEPYDFWRPPLYAIRHYAAKSGPTIVREETVGDAWDVLETLIGGAKAAPRGAGLLDRAEAKVVGLARRLAYALLWRSSCNGGRT